MKIKSFAKINLGLKILRKREDGFHDLETLFKIISLSDDIQIEKSPFTQIFSENFKMPTDSSNIMIRAINLLSQRTGRDLLVTIHINKKIPIGAGLGGGSSNGAAILVAINKMFDLKVSENELLEMGAELGSDVPFFVGYYLGRGNSAIGRGRGEILEFFNWDTDEQIVVVNPGIHISTPWAFQNFSRFKPMSETYEKTSFNLTKLVESTIISALLNKSMFFDNDFEPLVFAEYSKIKHLREKLELKGARLSRLSGSGSTVFGVFDSKQSLNQIQSEFPDNFCEVCKFL